MNTLYHTWGTAGNHIRWLMYFDKSFDPMRSLDIKLKFIQLKVYPKERTWHNWLTFEWEFRRQYQTMLKIEHDLTIDNPSDKSIYLRYNDYTKPMNHYRCLNPGLNGFDVEKFKSLYSTHEDLLNGLQLNENKKIIIADIFWNDVLDKDTYTELIEFWNLENHYEYASRIHLLWCTARKRAYEDFCRSFNNDEFINFVKQIETQVFVDFEQS